jgi:hypothetical protein
MAVNLLFRRLRRRGHIVSLAADLPAEAFDGSPDACRGWWLAGSARVGGFVL